MIGRELRLRRVPQHRQRFDCVAAACWLSTASGMTWIAAIVWGGGP